MKLSIEKLDNLHKILNLNPDLFISVSLTSSNLQILKRDEKFLDSIEKMKLKELKTKYSITPRFSILGRDNERELLYFYAVDYKNKTIK